MLFQIPFWSSINLKIERRRARQKSCLQRTRQYKLSHFVVKVLFIKHTNKITFQMDVFRELNEDT